MKDFQQFLTSGNYVTAKKAQFYMHWTRQCYAFCRKDVKESVTSDEIQDFISNLSKRKEKWQVEQAREAIELYLFFKNRPSRQIKPSDTEGSQWNIVSHEMVKILRLKHLSLATERTYLGWVKSFRYYLRNVPPSRLNSGHLKSFLTHLAVERRVAASTQNQAFNALLFLYRNVLDHDLGDISDTVRAKRKRYLPVVLSRKEIGNLFSQLSGINDLAARVIYGCGLRLKECLKLRIKDIDFDRSCVVVRGGKGDKDRQTVLPESVINELMAQIEAIKPLYLQDRENDVPGVELPGALERKFPNAGKEWAWQWVFPSRKLSVDPRSKIVRRTSSDNRSISVSSSLCYVL